MVVFGKDLHHKPEQYHHCLYLKPMPNTKRDTKAKQKTKSATKQKNTASLDIDAVLKTLAKTFPDHPMDTVTVQDPYKVLVGCIISLRTKDEVTIPACERLFAVADTPEKMVNCTEEDIQKLIFPAGFFRNKSKTIIEVSQRLIDEYGGKVPSTIDELVKLKGVGRKTANLVVGLGFGLPAICVDIHVHRISNRLGYVETKDPEKTEMALRAKLPPHLWHIINWVMVRHGQEICKPIGARCDVCPIEQHCAKIDVKARKVPPK